ncbi:hypothetical protein, partial [Pyrobaculum sp.]|uniref:hypothetical protein n=1 Tax=Pyrobaculum sp. TaxID=2004705 RepID=UPI00316958E0
SAAVILRIDRLTWYVDGYYVQWRGGIDGSFVCGCGKANCKHVRRLWRWLKARGQVVYVKHISSQVRPRTPYIELGGGYLLYSRSPVIEYVEFTPSGPAERRGRGRPVPLAALVAPVAIS